MFLVVDEYNQIVKEFETLDQAEREVLNLLNEEEDYEYESGDDDIKVYELKREVKFKVNPRIVWEE